LFFGFDRIRGLGEARGNADLYCNDDVYGKISFHVAHPAGILAEDKITKKGEHSNRIAGGCIFWAVHRWFWYRRWRPCLRRTTRYE